MSRNRILIFTATYNERDNISKLCHMILGVSSDYDLLVVDDNSTDGTGDILDKIKEERARLHVIHRPFKMGLGSAHKLAMLYAIRNRYDVLVTMDADFSHDPNDIPKLLERLKDSDFVTGSRYMKGGNCDYTGYRKYISIIANLVSRILLRIPLHEYTTSFRAFRVNTLQKIAFSKIHSQGYSFFLETVFWINKFGFRCCEVPIHFKDRRRGVSKIPRLEILNGMYKLIQLFIMGLFYRGEDNTWGKDIEALCHSCGSPYIIKHMNGIGLDGIRGQNHEVLHCLVCGGSYKSDHRI